MSEPKDGMKALSLTQPWATLIAIGAKRIETRSWSTSFRGPIAIHASTSMPRGSREFARADPAKRVLNAAGILLGGDCRDLPKGAIVAIGSLVHVFPISERKYHDRGCTVHGPNGLPYDEITPQEIAFGDYWPGRFGWVLADVVRLLTPIPAKGSLGLWDVPPQVLEQIESMKSWVYVCGCTAGNLVSRLSGSSVSPWRRYE